MSDPVHINHQGTLVIDLAEADNLWNSLNKDQQFVAMSAMFEPLLASAKDQADRIEELEATLAKVVEMALEECPYREDTRGYRDWWSDRRTTLASLQGDKA